ncbi:MAG: methyltransferase domain-containing protein [Candidatus Babeliales bacterium]|nr:methyltransferase domain-containing protein [Candidatus Babeliales bacterium]
MLKNYKVLLFVLITITAIFAIKVYTHKSWKDILNYSQKWDAHTYHKHAFAQYDISTEALSHWPFKGNENVLDIGCGVGSISAVIAQKYVPNGTVLGIDLSQDMINFAQKKYNLKNLKFENMNASDICYINEFDLITSFYCIHWIKDQQAFLDKVIKCLKPSGKILFYIMTNIEKYKLNEVLYKVVSMPKWANYFKDYQIPWYFKSEEEFAQIVKNSGLKLLSIKTSPEEINFKDLEALTSWVKAIPFASHLPAELRQDLLHDLLAEYLKLVPMNKDGSIDFILPTLIVIAEKE